MRLRYLYEKIVEALSSGTLVERSMRFLLTGVRRPAEVLIGYTLLPVADRQLNVRNGFSDHRTGGHEWPSNQQHIRRIIAAYKAAKHVQDEAAAPFQIRGIWAEWIAVNHKKLTAGLQSENVAELSRLFENMFRDPCTVGTGGYDDYLRYRSLFGSLYIRYVWSRYRNHLLTLDTQPQRIRFPRVGNQGGVMLQDQIISIETLRHAYHAVEICELLRDVPHPVCVEIGGGLGGQAYQAIQMSGGHIKKYAIFDIPEVAALSSYFLLSAFPEKRVRLFGEGAVSVTADEDYDIAIFPHFAIPQLSNSSVDLFYNSCSFSEMDGATSREYLAIIERACRRYFLHDNHDSVFRFKAPDGSVSTNVIGSQLIPDRDTFKRIFKKRRVHALPEDWAIVHYEYLYERMARH